MKRILLTVAVLVAAGGALYFFPLFHVAPLDRVQSDRQLAAFDAAGFTETFWDDPLMSSLDKAADAGEVVRAVRDDLPRAREQFGRSVGLSRARLYFVRGSGTIVSVEKNRVGVSLKSGNREPDIVLRTGMLFGNTVRDATGLLDVNRFPNSRHFNEISAELNRIVEERVLPMVNEQARVGRPIRFVACVELTSDADRSNVLEGIPIAVTFD